MTVFVFPPQIGSTNFDYGLEDKTIQTQFGSSWIWPLGPNGQFQVGQGMTAELTAPGLTFPEFGNTDLELHLDLHLLSIRRMLDGGVFPWDTRTVKVKGDAWGWSSLLMDDDGGVPGDVPHDGIYSFRLSAVVGPKAPSSHWGLLRSQARAQFVFELGGAEYKDARGAADSAGATAFFYSDGGALMTAPIGTGAGSTLVVTAP